MIKTNFIADVTPEASSEILLKSIKIPKILSKADYFNVSCISAYTGNLTVGIYECLGLLRSYPYGLLGVAINFRVKVLS